MTSLPSFADRLQSRIEETQSYLVAGFDPVFEDLPGFACAAGKEFSGQLEERLYQTLFSTYETALHALKNTIPAVKPNIAFFEQFGIGGLRAFRDIIAFAQSLNFLVIADAKRGDIGSTAKAYSAAFLGAIEIEGNQFRAFNADALTVNPFLGFDTVKEFVTDAKKYGKGLFILVQTSNPGSPDIQGLSTAQGSTVSSGIASWVGEHAGELAGKCGFSGLGAVVGATFPHQAAELRALMPSNFFLIPGMGAQGGSAKDAVAGFAQRDAMRGAGLINLSRGLFRFSSAAQISKSDFAAEITVRARTFNAQVREAL